MNDNDARCPIIIEGVHTYCNYSPQNDYVLRDVGVFEAIDATSGDERTAAYCLSVTLDYPPNGRRYERGMFEQARSMLDRIVQSAYPVVSPGRMFTALGVDPNAVPALDEFDARAVVQAAIWRALYPADEYLTNPIFAQCGNETEPHVKNPRLSAAARNLYDRATRTVISAPVIDVSRAEVTQYTRDTRRIGPMTIINQSGCPVTMTLEPQCGGYFTDAYGKRVAPLPGMPFYVVSCPGKDTLTLNACTLISTAAIEPLEDAEARPSPYQPLGVPCCVEREECSSQVLSF